MIGLLIITGLAFALVSAAASVILWCSYATTTTDSTIAATTAVASIACMYLFAAARTQSTISSTTRTGMSIIIAVLFASSIAATVGWLESRYQAQYSNSLSTDTRHTIKQQQIADLTTDIQNLQHSARADIANNYRTRANRTQIKIDTKTQQRHELIRQLNQHQSTATNAGQALGNNLGSLRWLLWLALAAIVDLCPILCFATVAQLLQQQPNTTATPGETPQSASEKPAPALAATAETDSTEHPATDWIQQQILSGEKPVMRTFLHTDYDGKKLRHPDLKQIFETLTQRGIIQRQGQTYITTAGATA